MPVRDRLPCSHLRPCTAAAAAAAAFDYMARIGRPWSWSSLATFFAAFVAFPTEPRRDFFLFLFFDAVRDFGSSEQCARHVPVRFKLTHFWPWKYYCRCHPVNQCLAAGLHQHSDSPYFKPAEYHPKTCLLWEFMSPLFLI